jgi:hypothetical protein
LRDKYGKGLEDWWKERFVHTFDCLTQSEARYLLKTENTERVRNKIAEAEQEGNRRGSEKKAFFDAWDNPEDTAYDRKNCSINSPSPSASNRSLFKE